MASRINNLSATLALFALLASGDALACICRHTPPTRANVKRQFNAVSEVFSARIVGATQTSEDTWQLQIEVLEVWKGPLVVHDRISIEMNYTNTCAFGAPLGYELLAYVGVSTHRHLSLCSTKALGDTVKERKLLTALRERDRSSRASPNTSLERTREG